MVPVLGDRLHRRVTILIAFASCTIGLVLFGPSETLHVPEYDFLYSIYLFFSKLWILILGYSIMSVGFLFFFIPSLPEILDSVRIKEGISEDNDLLNDKGAGLYNAFYSMGAIIAPVLGGIL